MKNKTMASLLLGAMLAVQLILLLFPRARLTTYFEAVRPLAYGLLLAVCLVFGRRDERTYPLRSDILLILSIGILSYVGFLFIGGYFSGFGQNPMDTRLRGLAASAYSYLGVALMREVFRAKAMTLISGKHRYAIFAAAVLIFTFCGMDNIKSVAAFPPATLWDYLITGFLPLLAVNLFLCYAARKGGLTGNLVFQSIYRAVFLFSPLLPDIPQILNAVFLYLALLIMFILLDKCEKAQSGVQPAQKSKRRYHKAWRTLPAAVAALTLLFGLGLFPFVPVAVASNSMQDIFSRGALVLIDKVTPRTLGEIKEGDIIQFRSGNISIVHRVVAIKQDRYGTVEYVTKGDNNPDVDVFPVRPAQIVGFVRWHIPYLGYPSLLLSGL